ncbi:MAG: hypothetical protein HQ461_13670 [Deltaproteobacteria bacterium]|nr:hypothetical protein [Deltaproteobacteria bacterium]
MWIQTTIGFFSIVQKPEDVAGDTLTIRARSRDHIEALKLAYLQESGPIQVGGFTDYPYRIVAPRHAVEDAMTMIVAAIDYRNFKDAVGEHDPLAEEVYHEVWEVLQKLTDDGSKG